MSLLWRAFDGRDIKVGDRTFGTWTGLRMRFPGPGDNIAIQPFTKNMSDILNAGGRCFLAHLEGRC